MTGKISKYAAIHCSNGENVPLKAYPVRESVPFARGALPTVDSLCLTTGSGVTLPIQTTVLNCWPDGSVKWLLVEFLADLEPNSKQIYSLVNLPAAPAEQPPVITVRKASDAWVVDTGLATFVVDAQVFKPFREIRMPAKSAASLGSAALLFTDSQARQGKALVEAIECETLGPVRCTLALRGRIVCGAIQKLRFAARVHFFAKTAKTVLEFRLHNPAAALHPHGLWDLGDPASYFFESCGFSLSFNEKEENSAFWRLERDAPWEAVRLSQHCCVYQESSGGEHWESPTHRNYSGKVSHTVCGYQVLGAVGVVKRGKRAEPVLQYCLPSTVITASLPYFWQKFPKAMAVTENFFHFSLFPKDYPDLHELQGGEQATNELWLDFAADRDAVPFARNDHIDIRVERTAFVRANVLKDVSWSGCDGRYRDYCAKALDERQGFFAKREMIDEYGWRHFGDLYADHEAALHKEDSLFISHYNNQYDPLASFYRQYLLTGDARWQDLAVNLAKHLADIDINHTDLDREEYNHGLFWHTDHYLDAGTATHRMASREHLQKKNPAFCGIGPAAEHCYTSGLRLHYLLTGDPRFKELVLRLAEWCYLALRGPQTMLAALLRARKNFRLLCGKGKSRPLWHRFPLTRGTGNCIKASLDAFDLSGERRYLDRAAHLIRQAVHPLDPLDERNLANAELAWSYTVFLVAVAEFLDVKRERGEHDEDFEYARSSLLHYANWMRRNEYPFLEKKEILEYPNETWAAQDLRKSVIFYHAARYDRRGNRDDFLRQCRHFLGTSFEELARWPSAGYTRPLALVLQNGWVADKLEEELPESIPDPSAVVPAAPLGPPPRLTAVSFLRRTLGDFKEVLRVTSYAREKAWLSARLNGR